MRITLLTSLLLASLISYAQPDYDCKLWGLASEGGKAGAGTVFSYDLNEDTLVSHADFSPSPTGFGPMGSLLLASNGLFYGTAYYGGTGAWSSGISSCNGCGTFECFDPATDSIKKLYDFDYDSGPGGLPNGGPVEAGSGALYGMTSTGINNTGGAIYEYDLPSHGMITRRYFNSTDGYAPVGSLLRANNGLLYGMTQVGGANNLGVIFSFNSSTGEYTRLFDFYGLFSASKPQGDLIQASNGLLYGMTPVGGQYNNGTLFSYDISTNTMSKLYDFRAATGGYDPQGSLLKATNGKLYGLCSKGGANSCGTLFEYDSITGILTDKFNFDYSSGKMPLGSLMQASNGKLYGVTTLGGAFGYGTLFEYDAQTNVFSKKADFSQTTGTKPRFIRLVERCTVVVETLVVSGPNIFTPNGDDINDSWQPLVQYSNLLKSLDFSIYNRWGQKIFEGDKLHPWNGCISGAPAPDGTYYYLIRYSDLDGKSYSLKGFVALVR